MTASKENVSGQLQNYQLIAALRAEAIRHITAIFSHDYPAYHHFEVLIGAKSIVDDKGERRAIYSTRALVYLDSGCSQWHLVAEGEKRCNTPLKAMENFLGGAMVRFEEVIAEREGSTIREYSTQEYSPDSDGYQDQAHDDW